MEAADLSNELMERRRRALLNALGADVAAALQDRDVTDILVNADGRLRLGTLSRGRVTTAVTLEPRAVEAMLKRIAGELNEELDETRPRLQGVIPHDGSRIQGAIPPLVPAPCFAIRKHHSGIFPLADYLHGPVAGAYREALEEALRARANILIAGATGSAKTSFLNSLLQHLVDLGHGEQRLYIAEDTREIRSPVTDTVQVQTSRSVTLTQVLKDGLRFWPDRIVVGEVRGPEYAGVEQARVHPAFEMIEAFNTGHRGGLCTLHANSARDALARLEQLLRRAGEPAGVARELVAANIDLVVFIRRTGSAAWAVADMLRVVDCVEGAYVLRSVETEKGGSL